MLTKPLSLTEGYAGYISPVEEFCILLRMKLKKCV